MMNGNKIPPVKRCRDYHVYDYKGNRYLDLYLDGGRAFMGHKPGKTMLPIKNSLEKGVWAAYPSIYEHRLKKLLTKLFPDYQEITFFTNPERAHAALESLSPGTVKEKSVNWRPFLDEKGDFLLVKPMVPGIQTVIILSSCEFSPGDTISPVLLEGIIRNFHDFISFTESLNRENWMLFDNLPLWERHGAYLFFAGEEELYKEKYQLALEKKVIFPPEPSRPVIIPAVLSPYEIKTMKELFS